VSSRVHHAAAHVAARQAEQHELHRLQSHHSPAKAPQHGHFKGYLFRPGRAPAPPPPRRPPQMRPRRPAAGPAPHGHEEEHDLATDLLLLAANAGAAEPAEPTAAGAGGREDNGQQHPAQRLLRWRLKPAPPHPTAADPRAVPARRGGTTVAALLHAADDGEAPPAAEPMAAALVKALLATLSPQAGHGMEAAAAAAAALSVYLRAGVRGGLATLASVKALLVQAAKPAAPSDERKQDRRLLLPLQLLNADRPRTGRQCGEAIERLALVWPPDPGKDRRA